MVVLLFLVRGPKKKGDYKNGLSQRLETVENFEINKVIFLCDIYIRITNRTVTIWISKMVFVYLCHRTC